MYATVAVTLDIFFAYVHLHCIAKSLKKIKMSTLPPLKKFLRTPMILKLSGDGSDDIHKPVGCDLIGLIIANQSSLQRKITMQERHLC